MSKFWTASQNPGENIEILKKVPEIDEIIPLTEQQVEWTTKISEIAEVIPLTKQQIEEFKDVKLDYIQISKLKQWQFTIEELTKLRLDQLKLATEKAKQSAKVFVETLWNSEVWVKTKEALEKAKEKVKEVWSSAFFDNIIKNIKSSFGELGKILAWILSFFKWIFSFWGKAKDLKNTLTNKLSTEEISKTKTKLLKTGEKLLIKFEEKTEGKLLPESKKNLQELINKKDFFTESQINIISDKMKEWDFKLSSLSSIISKDKYKELYGILFSPKQIEFLKNDFSNQAMEVVAEEYSIDLRKLWKKEKEDFRKALMNTQAINEDLIKVAEDYQDWKFLSMWELIKVWFLTSLTSLWVALSVIKLVPFVNIAENIAKWATELLELSWNNITEQNIILAKLENLTDEQKSVIFWIMLRKWMFIFRLLEKASFWLTRIVVETMIWWNKWNSISNASGIITNDFKNQTKLLDSLTSSLWQTNNLEAGQISNTVKRLSEATNKSKEILQILNILKNSPKEWLNIQNEIAKLSEHSSVAKELSQYKGSDLKEKLNEIINKSHSNLWNSIWIIKSIWENKFWFSKNAELFKLIQSQELVLKSYWKEWSRYLDTWVMWKYNYLDKLWALKESIRFSQNNRNIEIHATSLQDWATKLAQLEELWQHLPKLVGSAVWVAWISIIYSAIANKEETESFLETIGPKLKYLIPTYWPITVLLNDTWVQKSENGSIRDSIKMWMETWAMLMFLWMDIWYISTQVYNWAVNWNKLVALKNVANYHLQIIKSPIDLAQAVKNVSISWYNMYKNPKTLNFNKPKLDINNPKEFAKTTWKEFMKIIEKLKIKSPAWIALAIWLTWMSISAMMDTSQEKMLKEFKEKWYLTDSWYNFDILTKEATQEEKLSIAKMIILWNWQSNIDIDLDWDKLSIISRNKDIQQSTSLLMKNQLTLLKKLWIDTANKWGVSFEYVKSV